MEMQVLSTADECRSFVLDAKASRRTVGLVPTMGALHDGHLSLITESRNRCDLTAASIFVNPTQFAAGEDFDLYPRTLERDLDTLRDADVEAVFVPSGEEMYPGGFSTFVDPPRAAETLEGVCRPGHFRGVCTVVLKLFAALPVTHAFFGRKDYQQLKVIQTMTRDFNLGIQIVACETVREPDGLAMSSRNRYLDAEQRQRALRLYKTLAATRQAVREGEADAEKLQQDMRAQLLGEATSDSAAVPEKPNPSAGRGVDHLDYAVIVDAETLQPVRRAGEGTVALVAAFVGHTRLIDNMLL